jgi:hypothetical protein
MFLVFLAFSWFCSALPVCLRARRVCSRYCMANQLTAGVPADKNSSKAYLERSSV